MFTPAVSEAKDATCPACGAAIPLDDINVAKDIALCRTCGKTWTFSLVSATNELKNINLQNPPKGVRVETDYEGGTKITFKKISGAVLFLIPFTALWGGGSMFGIYGTQIRKGQFHWFESLFGIPFLIGTIVLCSVTAFLLFGRWEIKVRRREVNVFVGVGRIGWRRQFACGPNAQVSLEMSNVEVNNRRQEAIVVQEDGKKLISFASGITSRETKLFIAAALSRELS